MSWLNSSMNKLMKQCLQETMSVVDVNKIKPLITNDIPPPDKYPIRQIPFQNNRNNGKCVKYVLKSLIKAPEQCQVRSFGYVI